MYEIYGPEPDLDSPGDPEYLFALAAINTLRAQCNLDSVTGGAYPPLSAEDAIIDSEGCRSRVVAGQVPHPKHLPRQMHAAPCYNSYAAVNGRAERGCNVWMVSFLASAEHHHDALLCALSGRLV